MKKKITLLACLMLASVLSLSAAGQITLTPQKIDITPAGPGHTKVPAASPFVWQDDYRLDFQESHPAYTLTLIDENGEQAYQTVVPAGTTTLTLPSWLSGEYEIRLQPSGSSIYFYGWIEL